MGIFSVDLALTPYAPFTRNTHVLREALAKMAQPRLCVVQRRQPRSSQALNQQAASASQTAAADEANAGGVAAARGPRQATRCCPDGVEHDPRLRRDGARSAGLLHHQRSVRHHQLAPQPPRPQEPDSLFGRDRDSAGRAPALSRRHRRRQSRQRQHLHDGRRRSARRERAGEDSRPGQPGRGRRHRHPRVAAAAQRRTAVQSPREERGRAASGSAQRARRARAGNWRPGVRQHQQPAPGIRSGRERPAELLPARLHAGATRPTTDTSATSR